MVLKTRRKKAKMKTDKVRANSFFREEDKWAKMRKIRKPRLKKSSTRAQ